MIGKKKEYSVKEYAKLKKVTVGAVYKAIRENRVNYTTKFGIKIIIVNK